MECFVQQNFRLVSLETNQKLPRQNARANPQAQSKEQIRARGKHKQANLLSNYYFCFRNEQFNTIY